MTALRDLDALFLDVGGTLIHPRRGVGARYAAAARALAIDAPHAEVGRRFQAAFRGRRARARAEGRLGYGRTEQDARRFWRSVIAEVFEPFTDDAGVMERVFEALYADFAAADAWEVFPDALPVLDAARDRGLPVLFVSNWDARLGPLVDVLGLRERAAAVIGSYAVGAEKPDALIFDAAVAAAGAPRRDRILHVGDSLEEDFEGARAAGLRALHLVRDAGEAPSGAHQITSLLQLL